jgi:hypothetical protein
MSSRKEKNDEDKNGIIVVNLSDGMTAVKRLTFSAFATVLAGCYRR